MSVNLTLAANNWWIKNQAPAPSTWNIPALGLLDFGFVTVQATGTSNRLTPFFNYSTSETQAVKNIISYLYNSICDLKNYSVQVAVFKANGTASSVGFSCFHVVVISSTPLALQFLRTSADTLGSGHELLLASGYLYPSTSSSTLATDLAPPADGPTVAWNGSSLYPAYASNWQQVLAFMASLQTSITVESVFTSANYAWFDSGAADFGEPDTTVVNAAGIINDIFGSTPLSFDALCSKYPTAAQEYYKNLICLWIFAKTKELPYYPSY